MKFCYCVVHGRELGIFFSWDETKKHVIGFSNASYQGCETLSEAKAYMRLCGMVPRKEVKADQTPAADEGLLSSKGWTTRILYVDAAPRSTTRGSSSPYFQAKQDNKRTHEEIISICSSDKEDQPSTTATKSRRKTNGVATRVQPRRGAKATPCDESSHPKNEGCGATGTATARISASNRKSESDSPTINNRSSSSSSPCGKSKNNNFAKNEADRHPSNEYVDNDLYLDDYDNDYHHEHDHEHDHGHHDDHDDEDERHDDHEDYCGYEQDVYEQAEYERDCDERHAEEQHAQEQYDYEQDAYEHEEYERECDERRAEEQDAYEQDDYRRRREEEYALDPVQQLAVDAALEGKNIFLTGLAGTGKSLVTKIIVQNAQSQNRQVAVAAPTGVAAVNLGLGAQTLHSLAGVRVPQRARDFGTMHGWENSKKWRQMEVLVIDEIGMVKADFLDFLDVTVRNIRHRPHAPFGGIQLIFVGDFAQLGPVPGSLSLRRDHAYKPGEDGADCFLEVQDCTAYAFQSACWREANFHHIRLNKVFRQADMDFVAALTDLRESRSGSDRVSRMIKDCAKPLARRKDLKIPEGIEPTILYCTNAKVDRQNSDALRSLNTERQVYKAVDTTSVDDEVRPGYADSMKRTLTKDKFFEQCQASKHLELKLGAQVMLLQNFSQLGLVNGSRGVVESFEPCPVAVDVSGEENLIRPDDHEKFEGRMFEKIKIGMQLRFDDKVWTVKRFKKFPLVKFLNGQQQIMVPSNFERTMYRKGVCRRTQIPLRLAWALTVHKSQGSTLDLVVADLKGCFSPGQAYVALSRAKSKEGLQIRNFSKTTVLTDRLVEGFYQAVDDGGMAKFLKEQAGIWWFPVLKHADWLTMFQRASSAEGKASAKQFCHWLSKYKPKASYKGWCGYKRSFVSYSGPSSKPVTPSPLRQKASTRTTHATTTAGDDSDGSDGWKQLKLTFGAGAGSACKYGGSGGFVKASTLLQRNATHASGSKKATKSVSGQSLKSKTVDTQKKRTLPSYADIMSIPDDLSSLDGCGDGFGNDSSNPAPKPIKAPRPSKKVMESVNVLTPDTTNANASDQSGEDEAEDECDNSELIGVFDELGELYRLQGNAHAANTYRKVCSALETLDYTITLKNAKALGGKSKVPGIGKTTVQKIVEFLRTGTMAKLAEKRALDL